MKLKYLFLFLMPVCVFAQVQISGDIKDKIMQLFFTKPAGEGTGIGLSLSYDMVVKRHGGPISIESKEGTYTLFTITVPII